MASSPEAPRKRRLTRPFVLAATAVVLLAFVMGFGAVVLLGGSDGSAQDASDSATRPEATTSPSTAATGGATDEEVIGLAPDGAGPDGVDDPRFGTQLVRLDGGLDTLRSVLGDHDTSEPDAMYEEDTVYTWELGGGSSMSVVDTEGRATWISVTVPDGGTPVALAEGVVLGESTWGQVSDAWGSTRGAEFEACSGGFPIVAAFATDDRESAEELDPSVTPRFFTAHYVDAGPGEMGCPGG